ncbi:prohibitin family protein [Nitratidesulfovibrio sp. D1]|uniref:prohibitin family protein n=1 Tax=Nitratidesulfovibrio sp. D1 TaxID=3440151 RepID=UPI003EB73B8A
MKRLFTDLRDRVRRNRVRLVCIGVVTALVIIFLWPSMVITIRPGELGVLYSRFFGGTILDRTYEEGIHIIQPWDILYVYDVRVQEETQNIDVLTVDGLPINVQVSLRYQLIRDRLPTLHQNIGPNYRNKIVIPIMTSAVRQTISNYRPNDLYSTARQELQDQMLVDAIEEMGRIPIMIHGFVVKSITLPEVLRKAIEDKLVAEQNYLRYNYLLLEATQEAKRKAIEGQGIQLYQELVNRHMTQDFLRYEGIKATRDLAASPNAKIVVVGGRDGLPLILNTETQPASAAPASPAAAPAPAAKTPAKSVAEGDARDKAAPQTSQPEPQQTPQPAPQAMPLPGPLPVPEGVGLREPGESIMDYIQRLDKSLLNPPQVKTPKQ